MKTQNLPGVFIPVSEIFPGIQSDIETLKQLLSSLSLTDTIFWCARLNNALSIRSKKVDHISRQQFGLNQFFTKSEIDSVNKFVKKHGDPERVTIFFRGQILELIRWVFLFCKDLPGDGNTFEDIKVRKTFGTAALIASDLWARRIFGNRFSLNGGIEKARERALGTIRKSVESMSSPPDITKILGRGWALFSEYFNRHFPTFEDDFWEGYGISIEQYYICLAALLTNYFNPYVEKMGSGIFNTNTLGFGTPYDKILKIFISKESQTADEIKASLWENVVEEINETEEIPPYDFRSLREKPIFRAKDGRAIILEPLFFCEKATIGPIFHILKLNRHKKKGNEIFGAFGNAFEDYTCDTLKRMFPDNSDQTPKRLECNLEIKTSLSKDVLEIDALINDVIQVVLFEIKAVLIREDVILTDDYEDYLSHLREKYSLSELCDHRISVKGIGQIARIVSEISSEAQISLAPHFEKTKIIFPVLLVHDPLLVAPVYGKFFADEFKIILNPDSITMNGDFLKNHMRIKPLILMTIDDLENLENSIEHFGFKELLEDYSSSCGDRLVSLHNFISSSDYSKKIYHNKWLAGKAMEILDRTKSAIFDSLAPEK